MMRRPLAESGDPGVRRPRGVRCVAAEALKLPVRLYQWTIRPWTGQHCRHLPTCSDYALEAIDRNGAWKGGWLMVSRICRCHPWGSHGYDPPPDLSRVSHPLAPWRYGRWTGRHIPRS